MEELKAPDQKQIIEIVAQMGESILVIDTDARVSFVNGASLALLGYDRGELVGMPLGSIIEDENLVFFRALRQIMTKGPIRNFMLNCIAKGGERIPVAVNGSAYRDEITGKVLGMIIVARDMRDICRLIKELEEAKTGLEAKVRERTKELEDAYTELKGAQAKLLENEKMASIGQLAAGIAHEINNPLAFLSSNIATIESSMNYFVQFIREYDAAFQSMLSNGAALPAEAVKAVEMRKSLEIEYIIKDVQDIVRESLEGSERIKNIVADLREFSQVDSIQAGPLDINKMLDSTINHIPGGLRARARITRRYGQVPEIIFNSGELNQVFMNILLNACQAVEDGAEVKVTTFLDGANVIAEIADNGCGIPPENLQRIFEPFFTTKAVGQGTGLGLSIVYNIVKRNGGEISVKSVPGKGTAFTLAFPLRGV